MQDKKPMTLGEIKRAIADGTISEAARAEAAAMMASVQLILADFVTAHAAYKTEAEALHAALADATLPQITQYVESNPPSPGAIAYLVFVAREAMQTELARESARRRHDVDPKQAAKALVRECWDEWQEQPDRYKGKAAFARDMLDKSLDAKGMPVLESQPVIERWCREWERQT